MTSVSSGSSSTADPYVGRAAPWNNEAEQAVLGAMLLDQDAALRAAELLDDWMFYREGHRRLFRTMLAMTEQHTVIDHVTLRDELRYGIQYAISNGGLGFANDGDATLTRGATATGDTVELVTALINPLLPGFSFTLNGTSRTRFIIDTLSALTEVNMISSPNILVLDNKVARLRVGDEVPIVTQTTTSAVTDNPLIVNTVQYRSTGVTLEVTPRVNASGLVEMEIAQEVSDVSVTTSSSIDSPTIQNRSILTTVVVQDGETVMLGGLIREEALDGKSGIPILHRIPVIGSLFGQTDTSARRTELVVLIRPRVIANPDEAQDMTRDMRRKFLTLLQLERTGVRQPRRIVDEDF